MLKIVIVVVVDFKGRYLLIRRSPRSTRTGQWETVAGHIEKGETVTQAALREVLEETGLEVS